MATTDNDIKALAELRERLHPQVKIEVPREVLEDICDYCEVNGLYDKLGNYGDFYYKIKKLLNK